MATRRKWLPGCMSAKICLPFCRKPRKPDCPSAEICLRVCTNQADYLRKPGPDSCLRKPDPGLANLRWLSAQNCLCKPVIRDIGCPSAQTGHPVSQIWLRFCVKFAAYLPKLDYIFSLNLAAYLGKPGCVSCTPVCANVDTYLPKPDWISAQTFLTICTNLPAFLRKPRRRFVQNCQHVCANLPA